MAAAATALAILGMEAGNVHGDVSKQRPLETLPQIHPYMYTYTYIHCIHTEMYILYIYIYIEIYRYVYIYMHTYMHTYRFQTVWPLHAMYGLASRVRGCRRSGGD